MRVIVAVVLASAMVAGVAAGFVRPAAADVGDISVGGVWVSTITRDASGYSADQRAREINKRITEVLSKPEFRQGGAAIYVRAVGASATILVADQLVMTVTPEDAAGTGVSTVELARQWAQRLAKGLSKALPDANIHTF
jgi:hypothetical protein